jgi:hypothetical protein
MTDHDAVERLITMAWRAQRSNHDQWSSVCLPVNRHGQAEVPWIDIGRHMVGTARRALPGGQEE